MPAVDIALKAALFFGVSVEWLVTGKDSVGIEYEEMQLLKKWRRLDERGKKTVIDTIDGQLKTIQAGEKAEVS